MKTIGEFLKESRLAKDISLEDVSRRTKIQVSYLQAIENNQFDSLPASAFVKGFIQNFSHAISLDPQKALAIFRRDFSADKHGKIIPRSLVTPLSTPSLITPKRITLGLMIVGGLLLVGLLTRQLYLLYTGPQLQLIEPKVEQVNSPFTVSGQSTADASIMVNDKSIPLSPDGTFSTQVFFTPGDHIVVVTASLRNGKTRTIERFVTVNP